MKNLFVVSESSRPSGAYGVGTFVGELTRGLRQEDSWNVHVLDLYSTQGEFSVDCSSSGIKAIRIPMAGQSSYDDNAYAKGVLALLDVRGVSFDGACVVLNNKEHRVFAEQIKAHYPTAKLVFVVHYFGWMWPLKADLSLLYQCQDEANESELAQNVRSILAVERELFELVDQIVCLSEDSIQLVHQVYGVPHDRLSLIPNGLTDVFRSYSFRQRTKTRNQLHLEPQEKVVLYVGRLDAMKGVDILLSAFNQVVKKEPRARLVVVGDGNFSQIIATAGRVATKITFVGKISAMQLRQWYTVAEIGVLPSYSEECSFTGIEMLMYGLPMVTSDGRGVRTMFHDKANAMVATCRKTQNVFCKQLAEKVCGLLCDSEQVRALGKRARSSYLQNYRAKRMIEQYKDIIESFDL